MRILLTNDDGIQANGLRSLVRELGPIAELYLALLIEREVEPAIQSLFLSPLKQCQLVFRA